MSLLGAALSSPSIRSSPAARITSVIATDRAGSFVATIRPLMKATWSGSASPSGAPSMLRTCRRRRLRTSWQARCTAEPAEAAVHDPPSTGEVGRDESPSRVVTASMGRPSASAAICVRMV